MDIEIETVLVDSIQEADINTFIMTVTGLVGIFMQGIFVKVAYKKEVSIDTYKKVTQKDLTVCVIGRH